ncbi:MAG: dNTP triphosphohydrolase, partial [SAR202 cluster bacterium]|nr:dNTP triphosphohydrolase [SAR202 cluster bacterium]
MSIRENLEAREHQLSKHATKSFNSTRAITEPKSEIRTEFQRDRDRIIHSNAFRRLKHKTQVFIAPKGDHYVTRLTHTLEVSQIGRTIARALNLNEDLVEAMTLGHDIGHTPFGHAGEEVLNEMVSDGFSHASQSIRLVEVLEKEGQGLNLTEETKEGILRHSKPKGNFLAAQEQISLES